MFTMVKKYLRSVTKKKTKKINLRFSDTGTNPQQNTAEFLKTLAANGKLIHSRSEGDFVFLGRFMHTVLLIENALNKIIKKVDPEGKRLMLGQKIDFYKEIVREIERVAGDSEDWSESLGMIDSLHELKGIRDKFSHDISKVEVDLSDIKKILTYIKQTRPDKLDQLNDPKFNQEPVREKVAVYLLLYSFCVLEKLSHIELLLAQN